MTEEGELKKRMEIVREELRNHPDKNYVITHKQLGILSTVESWVDEAKKDIYESMRVVEREIQSIRERDGVNFLYFKQTELICSLKKWFGGCEESGGES